MQMATRKHVLTVREIHKQIYTVRCTHVVTYTYIVYSVRVSCAHAQRLKKSFLFPTFYMVLCGFFYFVSVCVSVSCVEEVKCISDFIIDLSLSNLISIFQVLCFLFLVIIRVSFSVILFGLFFKVLLLFFAFFQSFLLSFINSF